VLGFLADVGSKFFYEGLEYVSDFLYVNIFDFSEGSTAFFWVIDLIVIIIAELALAGASDEDFE